MLNENEVPQPPLGMPPYTPEEVNFAKCINRLASIIHYGNKNKGFWPPEGRNFGECIALIHSEYSEALEGHRKNEMDSHLPHRSSPEVEVGDGIIRSLDLAAGFGFDIGFAIIDKLRFNASRPPKHGKAY